MDTLHRIFLAIATICRGVVRATRSILDSSEDPEIYSPLLPQTSAGIKKRSKSASVAEMGTSKHPMNPVLPDMVVRVGPAGRLSNSLPIIRETFSSIALQIFFPFFIAGLGMVGAGLFLDSASNWKVYEEVPELIVLVPALLGLKGNLEMTLASRLSTEANLGNMDNRKEQIKMILFNFVLVQCQATVIGLLSSLVAVAMVGGLKFDFTGHHTLLLCACSTLTASIASFVLGIITSGVIVLSKKWHVNPDNIATPLAGSLGDITSLVTLSYISESIYSVKDSMPNLPIAIICLYLAVLPVFVWLSKKNKYTKPVLYNGWTPVISAMLISLFGGLILDVMVNKHKGVAVFQPVINGVGGNLVSIQASRLSTALHQQGDLGDLPENFKRWISPVEAFFSDSAHALTARVLMFLMWPGHIAFAFLINYLRFENKTLSLAFITTYLMAASIQVAILLYVAYILTHTFWMRKINPDNSTIPYLTALGDLLGIVLLGLTFVFLDLIGQPMLN